MLHIALLALLAAVTVLRLWIGVLALAQTEPFARALVNSGRLSLPACYQDSSLNTAEGFEKGECEAVRPGAAAVDAPVAGGPSSASVEA